MNYNNIDKERGIKQVTRVQKEENVSLVKHSHGDTLALTPKGRKINAISTRITLF